MIFPDFRLSSSLLARCDHATMRDGKTAGRRPLCWDFCLTGTGAGGLP